MKIYSCIMRHTDKLLHFLLSNFIVIVFFLVLPLGYAILIAALFGIGKEAYDQWSYQGWSWYDLIADSLGIVSAYLIIQCLIKILT